MACIKCIYLFVFLVSETDLCMWNGECLCVQGRDGGEGCLQELFVFLKPEFHIISQMFSLLYIIMCIIIPIFIIVR